MTDNPAQKLAQLLSDPNQSERERSAQALALAFAWNRATLQSTQNSRAGLILALNELAKALVEGRESLAGLDVLVDKALPSSSLRETLMAERASVSQRVAEVQALQSEVTNLEQLEQKDQALIAEQKKLQARQQELACLASFDPSVVDALRRQVQAVEEAKPWLSELEKLKEKLHSGLPQLEQLTGEALLVLQGKNQRDLKAAQSGLNAIQAEARQQSTLLEQINQNLLAVQADISTRQKRYQDAENELRTRKEILDQYIRVDREIAAAINSSEAQQAQQILDEIETRLHSVDTALRLAIEANEKARKIQQNFL